MRVTTQKDTIMTTHTFIGNLVDSPTYRVTEGGTPSIQLRIAVNESYRDEHGQWKDRAPVFWDAYAWRKAAELIHQAGLEKGQSVIIEARIDSHTWENEAGERRSRQTLHILNIGANIVRPKRAQNAQPQGASTHQVHAPREYGEYSGWDDYGDATYMAATPGTLPGTGPVHADSEAGL